MLPVMVHSRHSEVFTAIIILNNNCNYTKLKKVLVSKAQVYSKLHIYAKF